jgi:hypothetical protein
MYYLYYVINDRDMNNEINPILLDSEFDSWICENLMYQLMIGYDINGSKVSTTNIKDSGKSGSERIYQTLKEIEQLKGIKL